MGEQDERLAMQERIAARLMENEPQNAQNEEIPAEDQAPVDAPADQGAAPAPAEAAPAEQPTVNPNIPEVIPQSQPEPAPQQAPAPGAGMMQYLIQRLQQAEAQNAQLMAQAQQAQQTVQEQSQAAQGAVEMATSQPSVTIPVLDFNEMQYDDDETRARKMADWQNAMVQQISDSVARQYAGQLQPIKEDWEAKRKAAERESARQAIWGDSRFTDFKDRDERIQQIINANPELQNMDPNRSYLMGGMIARGLDYNPNPTAEQLVQWVQANPDAQRMLDQQKAQAVADRNQQIPTVLPSSGLNTANAIPESIPQSMDDVRDRMAKRFGR
jgi:hypothetical protein